MATLAGRTKPPAGATVDWGHPLARGLVWLFAPSAPGVGDLLQGGHPTLRSAASWKSYRHGLALDSSNYTSATAGASFPWSGRLATITTRFAVAVWADVIQHSYNGRYIDVPISAAGGDPVSAIALARTLFADSVYLHFGYGTSAGNSRVATSAGGFMVEGAGPGSNHLFGAQRDGTAATFWKDGVLHSSATFAGNEAVYLANQRGPGLLNQGEVTTPGSDLGIAGRTPFAAVWNRPLSAREWQQLWANPYQMLRPAGAFLRLWAPPPPVPSGPTADRSVTYWLPPGAGTGV